MYACEKFQLGSRVAVRLRTIGQGHSSEFARKRLYLEAYNSDVLRGRKLKFGMKVCLWKVLKDAEYLVIPLLGY